MKIAFRIFRNINLKYKACQKQLKLGCCFGYLENIENLMDLIFNKSNYDLWYEGLVWKFRKFPVLHNFIILIIILLFIRVNLLI